MFLDDKLYQCAKQKQFNDANDITSLVNELYKICEEHFKPQLTANMTYPQGTVIMDRIFSSWDLFVNRLRKEENQWFPLLELPDVNYRNQFMKNEKLKEIYLKGKK